MPRHEDTDWIAAAHEAGIEIEEGETQDDARRLVLTWDAQDALRPMVQAVTLALGRGDVRGVAEAGFRLVVAARRVSF